MANGFDTPDDVTGISAALVDNKYSFVIKYCQSSGNFPAKRFSHQMVSELHAAGIKVGFCSEVQNNPEYFTAKEGADDATIVADYFELLGVPKLIPCFAAYDLDIDPSQVIAYATAFHATIKDAGWLAGCYASGAVCSALKAAGLAAYTWLSNATGWQGYDAWLSQADIVQHVGSVLGLNSDPDTASSLDGWSW